MLRSIGLPELIILFVFLLFFIWPWSRIFSKAGYPGWLAVIMFIPLINIVLLFWFAFSQWPVLRRNNSPGGGAA